MFSGGWGVVVYSQEDRGGGGILKKVNSSEGRGILWRVIVRKVRKVILRRASGG